MARGPDVQTLVRRSAEVQPLWALLRTVDRARYLRRAAQAVIDEFDELERLLGDAHGRPGGEIAALELLPAIDALTWLADTGVRALGERKLPVPRATQPFARARLAYEPLGVVAIVGASDAPFAQPLWQVGAALLAGNGVVLKPSPRAPLAGERIARIFTRASLPEGLLGLATGADDVGRELVGAPGLARVMFTGTREAGHQVALACAEADVSVGLEVEGMGAALVLSDAGIARAAAGTVNAAFAAAGRSRGALRRAFVVRDVHESWLAAVSAHAAKAPPVSDAGRAPELIEEAVAAGARLVCGGPLADGSFAPAVLDGVTDAMLAGREPADGPLLAVTPVADADEALAAARRLDPGPGTSVWTADRYEGARIARALRTGSTWLNDHHVSPAVPAVPWGRGAGGDDAVRSFAARRAIVWNPPTRRGLWWGPYDAAADRAARAVARLRSVRDADRERALREGALPIARIAIRALRRR
jgi:acyl-CoA reductase-like NAD-dependent aldehyde dehydrogenase